MHIHLSELANALNHWSYVLIFISMFVDANVTIITSVVLAGRQALNPYYAALALFTGGILEQFLWYWVGNKLGKRELIMKWADKLSNKYDRHFFERTFHTLVISKFIYGLHRAVLIRAGMLDIGFKKFVKASFPATIIWLAVVGMIGLLFSASYGILERYLKYGELAILLMIILYALLDYIVSKNLKKEL